MKEFIMHCSSLGKIMGVKGLGKTGQSHIQEKLKQSLYKRRKEFSSKYTDKGTDMENEAIEMINESLGYCDTVKNEEYFKNDFIQGTPDIITNDEIIDIKCPWDCFTFPLYDKEIPNKDYYWQLQGYMWLTGKKKARLIYCLMDTPFFLIEREASYYVRNNPTVKYENVINELIAKMRYSDVDISNKVKVFDIKRNESDIQKIKDRVIDCRNYIKTLI